MTDSKIEWTEKTWEMTAGCTRVSEGCRNCYAEKLVGTRFYGMAERRERDGVANGSSLDLSLKVINPETKKWNGHIELLEMNLDQPLKRKKPTVYFVNSRSDLFHEKVPFAFIDRVFAVMALCPQHRFQVLTKRPERMAEYFGHKDCNGYNTIKRVEYYMAGLPQCPNAFSVVWPLPNVWLGTSVENQDEANKRIPHLLACLGNLFLSMEPLIDEVDLLLPYTLEAANRAMGSVSDGECEPLSEKEIHRMTDEVVRRLNDPIELKKLRDEPGLDQTIDWVIAGGESGPMDDVRICRLQWFRSLKDQCEAAGVPFFMKQMGMRCFDFDDPRAPCLETKIGTGKGNDMSEWPADLRVRQILDGLKIGETE